jgi:hypothetical protein
LAAGLAVIEEGDHISEVEQDAAGGHGVDPMIAEVESGPETGAFL